jgi:putative ABC transport system substrate-binding protein
MHRRALIGVIAGSLLAAPLAVEAQQPAKPVIGYLSSRSPTESADIVAAFHQGLREARFVDKQNVLIESRFAEGHFDRLPELAADLVRRRVDVIVATAGTVSVVKAKPVVPATIPLVFAMGGDPVKPGVVASLNRPGDNITGVSFLINRLAGKMVEFLHDMVPKAAVIGFLVNPKDPNADSDTREVQAAADVFGQKLVVAKASTEGEIDSAFATFVERRIAALFVDTEPFLATAPPPASATAWACPDARRKAGAAGGRRPGNRHASTSLGSGEGDRMPRRPPREAAAGTVSIRDARICRRSVDVKKDPPPDARESIAGAPR